MPNHALYLGSRGPEWSEPDLSILDNGRDAGPLANPAHYFILAGLFGIFSAGFFAMVLPRERPSAVSIRLGRDWWAPLGGVLICACGAFFVGGATTPRNTSPRPTNILPPRLKGLLDLRAGGAGRVTVARRRSGPNPLRSATIR